MQQPRPSDRETSWRITALRFPIIVLVILIHANDTQLHVAGNSTSLELPLPVRWVIEAIANHGARIAVPFFYIVSSYLLGVRWRQAKPSWRAEIAKRLRRLIPPYVGWNIFYMLFYWIGWFLPFSRPYFSGGTIKFESVGIGFIVAECFGFNQSPVDVPLWYIRNLIVFLLLSHPAIVFLKRVSEIKMVIILVFLTFLVLAISREYRGNMIGFPWFVVGLWLGLHQEPAGLKGVKRAVATVVWMVSCAAGAVVSIRYPGYWQGFACSSMFELVSIPSGLWVVWSWCGELRRFPALLERLQRLAPSTFVIYAAHGLILASTRKLVWKALESCGWPVLVIGLYLFCPLFTLAVCFLAHALIQRLPSGIQRWFDNRTTNSPPSIAIGYPPR